ncbi:MAG: hypothetical protein AABZ39_14460 [Spirochaetota bacterium]
MLAFKYASIMLCLSAALSALGDARTAEPFQDGDRTFIHDTPH